MYSSNHLEAALNALDRQPRKISAADWPGHLENLDTPGLYAWWVDEKGALDLIEGICLQIAAGRIYLGQAGATRWPSGYRPSSTLRTRIRGSHLGNRIGKSTFRFTFAASLLGVIDLKVIEHKELEKSSEKRLSQWMRAHLEVEPSDVRTKIEELREYLRKPPPTTVSVERANPSTPKSSVKLHEEIVDILQEHKEEWLTTKKISELVNKRGRYRKKDGSAVTAFQIHGRTKNYPHLFDRDGSRVRLKNPHSH